MAASRASSLRALNRLAVGTTQVRSLHMTGPSTFSSLLTTERPAINLPQDTAGLREECKKRNLPTTGSKTELTDRLTAHLTVNSRAYSTRTPSRPVLLAPASSDVPTRHFNTSRALKAVNDSSTIDFAYLPDFDPDLSPAPFLPRVPLLPSTFYGSAAIPSYATGEAADEIAGVMKPEIVTASLDGTHIYAPSAMSEVSDSGAVDFQGVRGAVAKKVEEKVEEGGMVKQVWGGLVEDLFGKGGRPAA
ncbi:uncharacterized protein BDZ99DRAFT_498723 [Mytilinidion resinicola]|uniref:SAP domain-containing protein n=1 Tax=Mytilinidion resinicola TaxID=574789 RepID=A0A6A6YLB5_9PEZI|nr:uncharacterized protein BDZ99DRAFT_498723 [Mytilinidion resinicola]KAF2809328.1 hypothetical protein BDZ99DRAFT_498723 [Mytilinidion resinicola]